MCLERHYITVETGGDLLSRMMRVFRRESQTFYCPHCAVLYPGTRDFHH